MSQQYAWRIYVPDHQECMLATELPWFKTVLYQTILSTKIASIADAPESANLIVIFEKWADKKYQWWIKALGDSFLNRFQSLIYVVSHDDYTLGLYPGCYTSLTRSQYEPNWHRACAYPANYSWVPTIESLLGEDMPSVNPRLLFSFRGNLLSDRVRRRMFNTLTKDQRGSYLQVQTAFRQHSEDEVRNYVSEMRDSRFALCPRGFSPSTYRLYESMQMGRCPVIISDEWVPPNGPDWSQCSIRISEANIKQIPSILREQEQNWERLGQAARAVWEHHFSESARFKHLINSIIELHISRQNQPLSIELIKRRLNSWKFKFNSATKYYRNIMQKLF